MKLIGHLIALAAILSFTGSAVAAVPTAINYQGRLTNAAGVPQPGERAMSVKIFDAAAGGTLLYSEDIGNVTADANGVYGFQFGAPGASETGTIASALAGSTEQWLELVVDGTAQNPRQKLLAVPFALVAGGLPDNALTSSMIADGAVGLNKISGLGTAATLNATDAGAAVLTAANQTAARQAIGAAPATFTSVQDFGAVGDGVTDDTAAIQAAINALEAGESDTLFFPSGTYRLASSIADANTNTSSRRCLVLGRDTDLAGRNIRISGESGARIYQDLGSVRCHILLIGTSFKSLTIENLTVEKAPTLLPPTGGEPSGNDAFALYQYDEREVDSVKLSNVTTINTHGVLFGPYNGGYGTRYNGKCRELRVTGSRFLNPYGANTLNSHLSYGGGQQFYLSTWFDSCDFTGNLFDGGGLDMTDASTCSGGKLKDAGVFGVCRHLNFTGNTVRRMGVETIAVSRRLSFRANTTGATTIPPADNNTTATVVTSVDYSDFTPGEKVIFYNSTVPTTKSTFEVVSWDRPTKTLTYKNSGVDGDGNANEIPGTILPALRQLYIDEPPKETATIVGNNFDNTIPPGGYNGNGVFAIVTMVPATISGNTIVGSKDGIHLYPTNWYSEANRTRGTTISSNTIITPDPATYGKWVTGIVTWQDDTLITGNTVQGPNGYRFWGIISEAKNVRISGNRVFVNKPGANGYYNINMAHGIAYGNNSVDTIIDGNYTSGMDVGVGPRNNVSVLTAYVTSHDPTGSDVVKLDSKINRLPVANPPKYQVAPGSTNDLVGFFNNSGKKATWINYLGQLNAGDTNTLTANIGVTRTDTGSDQFLRLVQNGDGAPANPMVAIQKDGTNGTSYPLFVRNKANSTIAKFAANSGDVFTWSYNSQTFGEGVNVATGTTTGTKIGTSTTQKIGFWNTVPVAQPGANTDTSGATLEELEAEVNELKALLRSVGLMAQ